MTILDPRRSHDGRDAAKPDPRAGTLTLPSRPGTTPLPPRPGTITLPPRPGTLTAGRLKVALVLNAAELNAIKSPKAKPRVTLRIRLADRTLTAEIAAKSLRKAQVTIREAGTDNIALWRAGDEPAT
jgi:hypothetical protein